MQSFHYATPTKLWNHEGGGGEGDRLAAEKVSAEGEGRVDNSEKSSGYDKFRPEMGSNMHGAARKIRGANFVRRRLFFFFFSPFFFFFGYNDLKRLHSNELMYILLAERILFTRYKSTLRDLFMYM